MSMPPSPSGGFGAVPPAYGQMPPQPPYNPASLPQQGPPYGLQPYPSPPSWDVPPPGRRTGRVVALVGAGVLVVVLGMVGFAVFGGVGFPEAKYRLRVPAELAAGTFTLDADLSDTAGRQIVEENRNRSHVRNPTAVVGSYTGQGEQDGSRLVVSGLYGRFRSPAETRDDVIEGAEEADGATVAVPARDVAVRGSDVPVECLVLTSEQDGTVRNVPMCVWGDDNTSASVGVVTDENVYQDPEDVDLEKVARTTLQVREEMREPG
ncbi:hypothetical protein [Streptomyces longisporoflavus]|uniref:Integral membrane protein n=1 Tax=Streptomyces longisporoflavus TaxID=28044 RepID=A0ABW7R2N3_9ACTN